MRADRILGWPAACSMVWPTSPGAMACSRRVRIAGEGRLELRIPERVPEGLHRLPDRLVHEHAAAGDAAVELGGDEAWLGLEVGGVGGPGVQEGVAVLRGDLEGVDEGDRPDLLGELVTKWYVLVHLDALQHHGSLSCRWKEGCGLGPSRTALPARGGGTCPGWSVAARISTPSTSRGPGREKKALASTTTIASTPASSGRPSKLRLASSVAARRS